MSDTTKPGAENQAPGTDATNQAAIEKAAADARVAERARVAGITGCEEAKGRTSLANHLAMNTSMSVDEAKAILAAAPAEASTTPGKTAGANPFKQAMDADKHPNVGADAGEGGGGEQDESASAAKSILAAQAAATGRKFNA